MIHKEEAIYNVIKEIPIIDSVANLMEVLYTLIERLPEDQQRIATKHIDKLNSRFKKTYAH